VNWLRTRMMACDLRTLGFFRIFFGLLLLANLYERTAGLDLVTFYTRDGLWPNVDAVASPVVGGYWSLLLAVSSPAEVKVAFAFIAVVYALYTVGYKTRFLKWAIVPLVVSVNNRNILPQHGGDVIVNIIAVWTAFLPTGERYSVDALLRSLRRVRETTVREIDQRVFKKSILEGTAVRLAYLGILLNFAFIYYFNALHKNGQDWRSGSAVHWVLWQNRISTHVAALLRAHEPFFVSPMMTWGTLVIEWTLPLFILYPYAKRYTRAVAVLFILLLHGSIAALCTLGPFSYAMMAFGTLLLMPEHWDLFGKKLRFRAPRVTWKVDPAERWSFFAARVVARVDVVHLVRFAGVAEPAPPEDAAVETPALPRESLPPPWPTFTLPGGVPVGGFLCDLAAAVIAVCVASQLWMENWGIPERFRLRERPEWMTAVIQYLDVPQGWSMFAPEAPHTESSLVIDATLTDGSHVDLLTGQPPDFEAAYHGPFYFDQAWSEVHARMPGWKDHWASFRNYLVRRPILLGWPEARRVSRMVVYSVVAKSPPYGGYGPFGIQKKELFTFP
jgi:hypothetical protein